MVQWRQGGAVQCRLRNCELEIGDVTAVGIESDGEQSVHVISENGIKMGSKMEGC